MRRLKELIVDLPSPCGLRRTGEFSKNLEEYKDQLKIRAQAARAAELLAMELSGSDENAREFNKLAWESSLWLPANLVCDISNCLAP